jgi:hypothetical protein
MDSRPRSKAPAAVFLILVAAIIAAVYGGAYIGTTTEHHVIDVGDSAAPSSLYITYRTYRWRWLAVAFRPAARIESWLTGNLVITSNEPFNPFH